MASAGLVGCLLRPSPAQHGTSDGGHDDSGHIPGTDGPISGPDAIHTDGGSGSGSSTGPSCPLTAMIDTFTESMQCGAGKSSGNGSAFATGGQLPMLAYDAADGPTCTWSAIALGSGFYIEVNGLMKVDATLSLSSNAQTATIEVVPDPDNVDVDLVLMKPNGQSTTALDKFPLPFYVGFMVNGSAVTAVHDSVPITANSPTFGTATFTNPVTKGDIQLETISTEDDVTFDNFCLLGAASTSG